MSSAKESEVSVSVAPETPVISPAQRRRLQQCYDHAQKLKSQPKQDYEYAHTLLAECITTDPSNLVYVDAFFDNLIRKYDNNKRGAKLQLFVNRGAIKKAMAAKQWLDVLKAGPEILKNNPWDVTTLRAMAEACENLQFNEVELRYLKMALDGNPKDVEICRHCAKSLARMGQYDQAIACWARVSEIKRNDPEAEKMIGDLQIEKTKWKFGMLSPEDRKKGVTPGGSAAKPAAKPADEMRMRPTAEPEPPPEEPAPQAPKKREVQLTRWQRLEQEVQQDPSSVERYLELAEAYAEEGKLTEAERALQRGLQASGNDLRIRERLEEAQIVRAKQQLSVAERRAQADRSEIAKELVKQLKEQLCRTELDIYGRRAERYPAESKWKYEVAVRLKKSGNYSEALKRLAEIPVDSSLRVSLALETGECHQYLKQYSKAMQSYLQAIDAADEAAEPENLKLALYRAGVLGGAMQDPSARTHLVRLVELDPSFRDAKDRLARATAKG